MSLELTLSSCAQRSGVAGSRGYVSEYGRVLCLIGVGRSGKTLRKAFVVTAAFGVHVDRLCSGLASPAAHHGVGGGWSGFAGLLSRGDGRFLR